MALVDYSGSEDSDQEEQTKPQETLKSKANTAKPTFQKVVDRSNPHKVRVNLSEPVKAEEPDEVERPSKRAKVGSGSFSGFNSLLPAPRRTAAPNGVPATNAIRKTKMSSGISLKTGAAPGFSREPVEIEYTSHDGEEEVVQGSSNISSPGQEEDTSQKPPAADEGLRLNPVEETKTKGKPMMFKPLSVARKPQKKKPTPREDVVSTKAQINSSTQQPKPAPKIPLFSTGEDTDLSTGTSTASGTYEPMIYTSTTNTSAPVHSPYDPLNELQPSEPTNLDTFQALNPSPSNPHSLTSIAADLNLTASQTRQLLGRQKNKSANSSTINVVNFNTDEEYAANEILRQAGETVQHNPVRAIAPGKHSLKQLVNAASNQKDALEESFASGRRNKKEAGSKYGW